MPPELLFDASPESPLTVAFGWVENVLTGSLATIVATIAVAGLGLLLLSGRIDVRHGLIVLLGCFILFGARTIAGGLRQVAEGDIVDRSDVDFVGIPPPPVPIALPQPTVNSGYDPYAGASVPQ